MKEACGDGDSNPASANFASLDDIHLAQITKPTELAGCQTCGLGSQMETGRKLIVFKHQGDGYCAYMLPQSKDVRLGDLGWIDQQNIAFIDTPVPLNKWAGKWVNMGTLMTLSLSQDSIHVKGNTASGGLSYSHTGDLNFIAKPKNNILAHLGNEKVFDDSRCGIVIINDNEKLIVVDNQHCGGMNVSFTDTYHHKK